MNYLCNDILCIYSLKDKVMRGKKTGGRQAGTPNKTTGVTKKVISDLLDHYNTSGKMVDDFDKLDPKDRITIAEKLMQYVMPKMQSTAVDMTLNDEKKTIEDTLNELAKSPVQV
jgi:hypothetical protein